MSDSPLRQDVTITHEGGLHLAPLSILSATANRFQCETRISHDGKTHSCKETPLTLLLLAAPCGAKVTLEAEGPGAEAALQELVTLFETNFGL